MTTSPSAGPSVRVDLARNTLGVLSIAGLIVTSLWVLRPFVPAFIWATMLVVATWPMLKRVERWMRGRRGPAVAVMTIVLLLVFVLPIGLALGTIVGRLKDLGDLGRFLSTVTIPAPPEWVAKIPAVGARAQRTWLEYASLDHAEIAARVEPYSRDVLRWVLGVLGGAGSLMVLLLLIVVISAILYSTGEVAAHGVRRFVTRLVGAQGPHLVDLAGQAIRAVALGVVVTAALQSTVAGIGLAVTGVPYAAVLTAVMLVLGIAQIGPIPVLVPAVIWLYWGDHATAGTVMLIWSLVVTTMDNIIRPVLIKRGADLPLLLIFSGVIGGMLSFGIVGLFIGPTILAIVYTLVGDWIAAGEADDSPSVQAAALPAASSPPAAP